MFSFVTNQFLGSKTVRILIAGCASLLAASCSPAQSPPTRTPKALYIIVDGIPYDVIKKLDPPALHEIAHRGGFVEAHVGGDKNTYNQTPTISAVGYNSLLTGTWANKHNVWDNDDQSPNYHYWNIFRIAEKHNPNLKTAIFSTWIDNRTVLIGEGLEQAGNIKLDYKFDGLDKDTVKYPHDKAASYIHKIDEAVADDAARYVAENGPDLSWVYLEYTDDMGHRFGDGKQYYDAILTADKQIGRIWNAIKSREEKYKEDWLIVITTDHGRGAETGKNHGGQSDRERSTWIVTNGTRLNDVFQQVPGIVDIMPSICNHLNLPIPDSIREEIDGVPFIGSADLSSLKAKKEGNQITLTWKKQAGATMDVYLATTNNFKTGGQDVYKRIGEVDIQKETYTIPVTTESEIYKILVKAPHHWANAWVVDKPNKN